MMLLQDNRLQTTVTLECVLHSRVFAEHEIDMRKYTVCIDKKTGGSCVKNLKRLTVWFLLAAACIGILVLPVSASYMEYEGLEITIEMDKEVYNAGEPITATITVKNTNSGTSTISNLEQLIPEGYRLAESSEASMKDVTLRGGQAIVMNVTFVAESQPETEITEDVLTKMIEGETWGLPNLLWGVILLTAFAIFMFLT